MFQHNQKSIGILLFFITLVIVCSSPFQQFASIPSEVRIFEGHSSTFNLTLPATSAVSSTDPDVVDVSNLNEPGSSYRQAMNLDAIRSGTTEVQLKVGNIPLKRMKVDVLPELKVYPGGQSIGVQLNSIGALVVGHHFIKDDDEKVSPGEEANIQIGDLILKINDEEIKSLDQIGTIVSENGKKGKPLELEILRGKNKITTNLNPIYDKKEDRYRLGLYIRNSAAGVGTLTFIHPESKAYGALGHVISDMDTQKPIVVGEGNIVGSNVSSIERGIQGEPGEKFSSLNEDQILGNIKRNTPFGIFGEMKKRVKNGIEDEPIPVGLSEEVEEGPAQILTVVEGEEVEKFDIEIVEKTQQKFPATKGLVIKVTDPVLLEKTGGIVQGMSGSPIIQNGKLVGAVTHVFVNDPTSGYGCFIEWMLQDAGISLQPEQTPQAS